MGLKVCKFGGTSMANAENLAKVKAIVTAEDDIAESMKKNLKDAFKIDL